MSAPSRELRNDLQIMNFIKTLRFRLYFKNSYTNLTMYTAIISGGRCLFITEIFIVVIAYSFKCVGI